METISLVYYSPTGTTQKIVREIGQNLGFKIISENNIAEDKSKTTTNASTNNLTIIGMPVYGGRLPITVIESLKKFQSNGSPAIIVVVYGNREYEDALLELKELVSICGFKIIAGAAFIGEHSYSTDEKPIAKNRPDQQDLEKCKDFAQLISDKLRDFNDLKNLSEPIIPGDYPFKERKEFPSSLHPTTDNDRCNLCGACVDACPTNAINIEETVITNGELCTLCCACVKYCPDEARTFDNPMVNAILKQRDVLTKTKGLADNSVDYVVLFNILHHESPMDFLDEAYRILKQHGKIGVIHWRSDISTPRGPDLSIRPTPEQVVKMIDSDKYKISKQAFILEPYHYGLIISKILKRYVLK